MSKFKIVLALNEIGLLVDDETYGKIKENLDKIEAELEKDDWTFCSDELPDEDDSYLVLWRRKGDKWEYYEIQEFSCGKWEIDIPQANGKEVEILAWQPLPDKPEV